MMLTRFTKHVKDDKNILIFFAFRPTQSPARHTTNINRNANIKLLAHSTLQSYWIN